MAGKLLTNEFQSNIILNATCHSVEDAIQQVGQILVKNHYVTKPYIQGMLEREADYSTYLNFGIMIPHGNEASLTFVQCPGISILQVPKGFYYLGHTVTLVIGISSKEEDPLQELLQITDLILKPEKRDRLLHLSSKQEFIDLVNENYAIEGEL